MKTIKKITKASFLIFASLLIALLSITGQIKATTVDEVTTNLAIELSPSGSIYVDRSVTVTATLTSDPLGNAVRDQPINFFFSSPDNDHFYLDQVTTDGDGKASIDFRPSEFREYMADGVSVSFQAEFDGVTEPIVFFSSKANPESLTVNFRSTELDFDFSPYQMAASETVTLTASLLYEDSTGVSIGVPNEPIMFRYSLSEFPDWTSASGFEEQTDQNGVATLDFVPADYDIPPGSIVHFKAFFVGDFGYLESENELNQPLELAPANVVPEYPLGAFIAILTCFAALATFKHFRKPA